MDITNLSNFNSNYINDIIKVNSERAKLWAKDVENIVIVDFGIFGQKKVNNIVKNNKKQ